MNSIALSLILAASSIGQFGDWSGMYLSVTTIPALSLPASDDGPAMVLCVYRLNASTEKNPHPTAEELLPVVRELFAPAVWQQEGAYLRAVNNHLLVRQRAETQREIYALLRELDAIPPYFQKGGPGLQSVIPVVGARPSSMLIERK